MRINNLLDLEVRFGIETPIKVILFIRIFILILNVWDNTILMNPIVKSEDQCLYSGCFLARWIFFPLLLFFLFILFFDLFYELSDNLSNVLYNCLSFKAVLR